jgi:hypothetical protein
MAASIVLNIGKFLQSTSAKEAYVKMHLTATWWHVARLARGILHPELQVATARY